MRLLLLVCLLLFSSSRLYAQVTNAVTLPISARTQKVTYTERIPTTGVSRAELYARAKGWLAQSTSLTHAVPVTEKKEVGVLVARAKMTIPLLQARARIEQPIEYTIAINVQEGYYQYLLCDYQVIAGGKHLPLEAQLTPAMRQDPQHTFTVRQYETQISRQSTAVMIMLQSAMQNPAASAKKEDPLAPYKIGFPKAGSQKH
ncbi:DUF4468 domain-containing protein [Hymenobacter crusticola]|uniref:DUF4468 domain-containing protein n=1 Tax=Hymenobacter crusticola TaxID=1770526 RepID=A0A243W5C4_9BACT|nr:DUF4468 domain-containing protein [Hymenobacter crusticola]OUJ68581.1 hypothetical protein BXP70_27865 [Hymenobacter crusticola]